jgi:coproporphyrinogen III oxidase
MSDSSNTLLQRTVTWLQTLQADLATELASVDPSGHFQRDIWSKEDGLGGGQSWIWRNGSVFESAGINFSQIQGNQLPPSATARRPELANSPFSVTGVSLVFHPLNPYVPTTHANFRFFHARPANRPEIWWFGGGFDLTPYYPFDEDILHWHSHAKQACDPFSPDLYPSFKRQCDDYFFLPHRNETRGVGGLFYDDLQLQNSFDSTLAFSQSVASHFAQAYFPIAKRRMNTPWGDRERQFQLYRRGRYVEFNLLFDRGTLFGIQSKGRTESILMSLPPHVRWEYGYTPSPDSAEARLTSDYLKPRDWLQELR